MLNIYVSFAVTLVSILCERTEHLENISNVQYQLQAFRNCSLCPVGYKLNTTDCNCTKCPSDTFGSNCDPCNVTCQYGQCNQENGTCSCMEGYIGSTCTVPLCTRVTCGTNGTCASPDQCLCDETYKGVECTERYCPDSWCAFGGTCRVSGVNETAEVVCEPITNKSHLLCTDDTFGPQCRSRFFLAANVIEEKTTHGRISDIVLPIVLGVMILAMSVFGIVGITYPYIRRKRAKAKRANNYYDQDDSSRDSLLQETMNTNQNKKCNSSVSEMSNEMKHSTKSNSKRNSTKSDAEQQPRGQLQSSHAKISAKHSLLKESSLDADVTKRLELKSQSSSQIHVVDNKQHQESSPGVFKSQQLRGQPSSHIHASNQESNPDTAKSQQLQYQTSSQTHALENKQLNQESCPDTAKNLQRQVSYSDVGTDAQTSQDQQSLSSHMSVSVRGSLHQESKSVSTDTKEDLASSYMHASEKNSKHQESSCNTLKSQQLQHQTSSQIHIPENGLLHLKCSPDAAKRQQLQQVSSPDVSTSPRTLQDQHFLSSHILVSARGGLHKSSEESKAASTYNKENQHQQLLSPNISKVSQSQESTRISISLKAVDRNQSQDQQLLISDSVTDLLSETTEKDVKYRHLHQETSLSHLQDLVEDSIQEDKFKKNIPSDVASSWQQSLSPSQISVLVGDSISKEGQETNTGHLKTADRPYSKSTHLLVVAKDSSNKDSESTKDIRKKNRCSSSYDTKSKKSENLLPSSKKKKCSSTHDTKNQKSQDQLASPSSPIYVAWKYSSFERQKIEPAFSSSTNYDEDDGEEPTPL